MENLKELFLLDGFKDAVCDLIFTGEDENGVLYDIRIDIGQIAEYLSIDGKRINLIDGSDDIMESARQIYEAWTVRPTSYTISVTRQAKLIFKTLQSN